MVNAWLGGAWCQASQIGKMVAAKVPHINGWRIVAPPSAQPVKGAAKHRLVSQRGDGRSDHGLARPLAQHVAKAMEARIELFPHTY